VASPARTESILGEIQEEEDVCVTVKLPDGTSIYVIMGVHDTVADLNIWDAAQFLRVQPQRGIPHPPSFAG
jgi:hypothetical protein